MKLNDVKKMRRDVEMPIGTCEAVFKKIDYRINKETEDVTGIFVHTEGYRPVFIPFFDNGDNFQLDLLLDQLGCQSYDPDEINQSAGTVITVHRYIREAGDQVFTNTSFNKNYTESASEVLA